jgi:hypothetical protein
MIEFTAKKSSLPTLQEKQIAQANLYENRFLSLARCCKCLSLAMFAAIGRGGATLGKCGKLTRLCRLHRIIVARPVATAGQSSFHAVTQAFPSRRTLLDRLLTVRRAI